MNIMPFSITYISLALEAFLGLFLLTHLFSPKPVFCRRIFITAYFAVYVFLMIFQDIWGDAHASDIYPVFLLLHIFLLFLFGLIFCEGKLVFKLFLPLMYVSVITLSASPAMLLQKFLPLPQNAPSPDVWFHIPSSLTLILITVFFLSFKINTAASYPISYYITMITASIMNMTSITLLKSYSSVFPYVNLVGFFTLALELCIYFMIWQSAKEYAKNNELSLIRQQQEYQIEHMKEISHIVTDYHQLRHDMKNHFACMDRFLSQEKYAALKDYFYSLSNALYAADNQVETGNEIANQIINVKYATAHQFNIPMEIDATLPKSLAIPDYIFCAVLSNLLDNAIEASEKIKKPEICVKLHIVKSYLSITVKNRIESWQKDSALTHKTTKSKPHLHGLGLRIVEEAVQTYNGISSYEIIDQEYIASVMLEAVPLTPPSL